MKNRKNKVKKYYRGKRKQNGKKYIGAFTILAIFLAVIVGIIIFKTLENKETSSDNKEKETSSENIEEIVAKPVDETVLQNLVTNAETIQTEGYTEESVAVFNTALEEAKNLLQGNYEQVQAEAACKKLVDAVQQLIKQ